VGNGIVSTSSIGIGTTSPSARLAVTSAGTGTGRAFAVADSSNTERFTILDNGNVGIGTVAPATSLDVRNAVSGVFAPNLRLVDTSAMAQGVGGRINFVGQYTSAGDLTDFGSIAGGKLTGTSGQYRGFLSFFTRIDCCGSQLIEYMRLDGFGSLGIGTTRTHLKNGIMA